MSKIISVLVFVLSAVAANGQLLERYDFADGFPAGWTTGDEGSSATKILWNHCDLPTNCPPATTGVFDNRPFGSDFPTPYLYATTSGVNLPANFKSFVQTNTYDFSSQQEVWLRFESVIGTLIEHPFTNAVIRVKYGNEPWVNVPIFCEFAQAIPNSNARSPNSEIRLVDLSAFAAGQEEVRIQWYWEGRSEWVWAIDNVEFFGSYPEQERIVWGTGSNEGQFENGLSGWTQRFNTNGGECAWEGHPTGDLTASRSATNPTVFYLPSPTSCNGIARLLLDECLPQGLVCPPDCPDYLVELTSPIIDLSGEDELLNLHFFSGYRLFDNPSDDKIIRVSWSADGGDTWSLAEDIVYAYDVNQWYFEETVVRLPAAVLGKTKVRLRFEFQGKLFAWAIDDVLLKRRAAVDLALFQDAFSLPPNRHFPVGIADPLLFQTDVFNYGNRTATDVGLGLEIRDELLGRVIFRDSIRAEEVPVNSESDGIFFLNGFEFPERVGSYVGKLFIDHSADENPRNDTVYFRFELNTDFMAKENGGISGRTLPDGAFEIGTAFYVGGPEPYRARSITFGMANAAQLPELPYTVRLYEWRGALVSGTGSNTLLGQDHLLLAEAVGEMPITSAQFVMVEQEFDASSELLLTPNRYYFAVVELPMNNPRAFVQTSSEFDYSLSYLSSSFSQPQYAGVVRYVDDPFFNLAGLGFAQIPVVRLNVEKVIGVEPVSRTPIEVVLSPNPATDNLTIEGDLEGDAFSITIFTIIGEKLLETKARNFPINVDIGPLQNGMYTLEIVCATTKAWKVLVFEKID